MISPSLTLYQDPEAGPYSCPFDDEGTPTTRLVFIQNGILQHFYAIAPPDDNLVLALLVMVFVPV